MKMPDSSTVTIVAAAASALSAAAAWQSALLARRAIRRTHKAFVWPVARRGFEDKTPARTLVWVRLHSDGPGVSQDVVAALLQPVGDNGEMKVVDRTPPTRALRSGEVQPPPASQELVLVAREGDGAFSVAVRWTDTAGQRWELIAPQDPLGLATAERRVRRWRWQCWRPSADW